LPSHAANPLARIPGAQIPEGVGFAAAVGDGARPPESACEIAGGAPEPSNIGDRRRPI
jgi:hypothetical protein